MRNSTASIAREDLEYLHEERRRLSAKVKRDLNILETLHHIITIYKLEQVDRARFPKLNEKYDALEQRAEGAHGCGACLYEFEDHDDCYPCTFCQRIHADCSFCVDNYERKEGAPE